MNDVALQTAKAIIAGVLGCRPDDIPSDAAIGSLPDWDSLAHISIIMSAEEKLERRMTAEEIVSFETVGSLTVLFRDEQEGIPT